MRKLPPLHILGAFEAVARHRSLTSAAEELCVTKSAVSHRIKLLEAHFEVPLFLRTRGGLELTSQGRFFLSAVREALAALEAACLQMPTEQRRVVRISVRPAFASNWLVGRLGDFHRQHENTDIEIYASKKTNIRAVGADIAICYGKGDEWSGFETTELLRGNLLAVCSPAYRDELGALEHPKDLLKGVLLRLARHGWESWFEAAGVRCRQPITGPLFSDAHLMLCAAASGQGVALAFDALAESELTASRLVSLFDLRIPSECAYFAVYPPSVMLRAEVVLFLDWLVKTARDSQVRQHGRAPAERTGSGPEPLQERPAAGGAVRRAGRLKCQNTT